MSREGTGKEEINIQRKIKLLLTIENRKIIYKAYFIMNLLLLGLSILFQIKPDGNSIWNVYGVMILLIFMGNLIMIMSSPGRHIVDYIYIGIFMISMLCLPVINTGASLILTNKTSTSIISVLLIISILILGAFISFQNMKQAKDKAELINSITTAKGIKLIIKYLIGLILIVILAFGVFLSYVIITGSNIGVVEIIINEYSLFYGYFFLGVAALIIKLSWRRKLVKVKFVAAIVGIVVLIADMLPMLAVPGLIHEANDNYITAFGDINSVKDAALEKEFFRKSRFSIAEYLFGTKSKDYNVTEDVTFYEGIEGVDQGINLKFDVYTPIEDNHKHPVDRTVLIRIHGGAWTIGDKGMDNFAQVNKYFAAQGYVVFDIQYGLFNGGEPLEFAKVQNGVMGNFSIDDMFRHVGLFTKYLAQHAKEYNADLNSVFISGGSAGGQLTNAVGLSLANGAYKDILDERIKVKGIIPFYPANGVAGYLGIDGTEELVEPANLVTDNSPPCLIFQGLHDGIVTPDIAQKFYQSYLGNNRKCALIKIPYATHGSDLYFSGYFNQVFLYYMERFMYQYR